MSDYQDYQPSDPSASPPWLSDLAGLAWSGVLGFMKQVVLEAAKSAAVVSFPSYAPSDVHADIAKDRDVVFGFPEKHALRRERLRTSWRVHAKGGTHAGIILALQQFGYVNVTVDDHSTDSTIPGWYFRVVLNRPFPFDDQHLADDVWSPTGAIVGSWGDGGSWATAMPDAHLSMIRAVIAKHKDTASRCIGIRVKYDASNPLDVADLDP